MSSKSDVYIVLRLSALFAAFHVGGLGFKPSNRWPTKSALLGIIQNAMGHNRGDPPIVRPSDIWMVLYDLSKNLGTFTDYQPVGGAEDDGTLFPITADGKQKAPLTADGHRKKLETSKQYLVDTHFMVVISGKCELMIRIMAAITYPLRFLYDGCKACPFSSRLDVGIYATQEEAEQAIIDEARRVGVRFAQYESDSTPSRCSGYVLDNPTDGGFEPRPVATGLIDFGKT